MGTIAPITPVTEGGGIQRLGRMAVMECTHHRSRLLGSRILQMLISREDAVLYPQHLPRTLTCMRAPAPETRVMSARSKKFPLQEPFDFVA